MWGNVGDVLYDTASDRLYVAGDMSTMYQDSLQVHGITYWKDGRWHPVGTGVTDPSGGLVQQILKIAIYDSALIAIGEFDKMGDAPGTAHCAQFRNGAWAALGVDTPVHSLPTGLYVIEDTLHMLGWFDTVGTQVIHKWAKWDGEQWRPGGANEPLVNQAHACAKYQGDYYVGGNYYTPNGINDLARWAGGEWHALGPGLLGDPWVQDLMVYYDLLWVAGEFFQQAGNAATGLMAWDGSNWINKFPQIQFFGQCKDLAVINNVLYFSGPFHVVGRPGEFRIGQYDGNTLCILGGTDVFTKRLTGSEDTLYVATCNYGSCLAQGVEMHGIMKWPLDAPADTCFEIVQSLPEVNTSHQIQLYPDPATTELTITWMSTNSVADHFEIMDATGRCALADRINWGSGQGRIALTGLRSGIYILRVLRKDGTLEGSAKFVLQP
jgi:hypothetical protein